MIYVVLGACRIQLINHLKKVVQPESKMARAHLCDLLATFWFIASQPWLSHKPLRTRCRPRLSLFWSGLTKWFLDVFYYSVLFILVVMFLRLTREIWTKKIEAYEFLPKVQKFYKFLWRSSCHLIVRFVFPKSTDILNKEAFGYTMFLTIFRRNYWVLTL